jgi:hypothetical protein
MARKYNNLPEIEEKTSFEKLKEEYKWDAKYIELKWKDIDSDHSDNFDSSENKIKNQIKEDTIVLIRENWILKIGSTAIFSNKDTWIYTQRDATEKYILVDFDSTKVAPIAKWILNELSLFPELKWIKWVARWNYAIFFFLILTLSAVFIFTPSVNEIVKEIKKIQTTWTWSISQSQKTPQEIFRQIEEKKLKEINLNEKWANAE